MDPARQMKVELHSTGAAETEEQKDPAGHCTHVEIDVWPTPVE
jgi:hypothetical protein